jgi:4-hydroxy-4-methyl-2-oxoglutarate aldolase
MQSVTPANGSRRWGLTDTNQTISLPGQDGAPLLISPGDYVIADADGVVVIPQEHIVQIIEDSEKLLDIESTIRAAMEAGAPRAEAFKLNPRFRHVRKVS